MEIKLALHEMPEVINLQRFIKYFEIDVIFDVGANIGQYAQMLRNKVGFRGAIFSYEPFSEAFSELCKVAESDPNWYVFNSAISDRCGETSLNLVASSQMNSLEVPSTEETEILEQANTQIGQEKVKVITLDQAYEQVSQTFKIRNPLLKLDTQGHDLKILQGSNQFKRFVGIQAEVSFKSLYAKTPKYFETIEFLKMSGFELSAVFPNNAGHFPFLLEQDILVFNASTALK
jgi:FkbM family methyltransferase